MNVKIPEPATRPFYFKKIIWGLVSIWTLLAMLLIIGLALIERETVKEMALTEARAAFKKDMQYLKWMAGKGGVYIAVNDSINEKITKQDYFPQKIKIDEKTHLVLVTPAYIVHMANKELHETYGVKSRLISSFPIDPENVPDSFEGKGLEIIRNGKDECMLSIVQNGETKLLYMRKLKTEQACSKCHTQPQPDGKQFQGAASVVVPLNPIAKIINKKINLGSLGIGMLWIIGILFLYLGGERLNRQGEQKNMVLIRLNQSRDLLLEAQRIANVGSFEWNPKTNLFIGSENFYKIFGISHKNTTGLFEEFLNIIHPDDLERTRNYFLQMLHTQKETSWYFRAKVAGGNTIYIQAWGQIQKNNLGEAEKIIVSVQDISERKNSEHEIRKLSRAIEQSPVSVVITDTNGCIVYVNSKFEEISGYSIREAIGQNPRILKSGHFTKNDYKILWDTILSGNEWRGELLNKKKTGELYWVSASISSIRNEFGETTNFIAVKEDITKRKQMEIELNHALASEAESSRLKSILLANMSHELRTPMNGIMGFAQLLENEISEPAPKNMLKNILASGKRLMTTLNTILDLTELEANKFCIIIENVNIYNEVSRILEQYEAAVLAKGLALINECPKDFCIDADKGILHKILVNMIDNAVKFTNKGEIKVTATNSLKNGEGRKMISEISVADTGIGIDEKNLKLIFQEFRQASEGYNRSFEGSGLGLTLARKMALLLNGDITVTSEIGKGSVFSLKLPSTCNEAIKTKSERISIEENNGRTKSRNIKSVPAVLLVEDNEINTEVVRLYLNDNYNIECVSDGKSAIKIASEKQFNLILMDINLGPGITGIEATREIRKLPNYANTPIVALTGYAMRKDKERFLSEGLTHYLAKPFEQKDIVGLLANIFGNQN
jgi:PAS domain S-box-containing protein